jgi:hypothetical protein
MAPSRYTCLDGLWQMGLKIRGAAEVARALLYPSQLIGWLG